MAASAVASLPVRKCVQRAISHLLRAENLIIWVDVLSNQDFHRFSHKNFSRSKSIIEKPFVDHFRYNVGMNGGAQPHI